MPKNAGSGSSTETTPGAGTGIGQGGGGFSGGGGTGSGGHVGGGGSSSGGSSSGGSSGGSGWSGGGSGSSSGGSGNQGYSGPSQAEIEAARQAAYEAQQTAKRQQKDQAIAEQTQKAQREKRNVQQSSRDQAQQESSTVKPLNVQQQSVAPKIQVGDGSHGAGEVDLDTGEIVTHDIPGRDSFYEAPSTSGGEKPRVINTHRSVDAAPQVRAVSGQADASVSARSSQQQQQQQQQQSEASARERQTQGRQDTQSQQSADQSSQASQNQQQEQMASDAESTEEKQERFAREQYRVGRKMRQRPRTDRDLINEFQQQRRQQGKVDHDFDQHKPLAQQPVLLDDFNEEATINQIPSVYEVKREANRRAADETAWMYRLADLPAESRKIGDDFCIHYSDEVETAINTLRSFYGGISEDNAVRLIILRLGLGVDSKMQVFNQSLQEYEVPDMAIQEAVIHIMNSQQANGHPLGLVDGPPIVMEGSFRYPIGVVPAQLAEALVENEHSPLYGKTPEDVVNRTGRDFVNRVLPRIYANTRGDKINQRYALENMVRAIASLDGRNAEQWGVSNETPRRAAEIREQQERERQANKDQEDVYDYKAKHLAEVEKRMMAMRGRRPIKDKNGQITGYTNPNKAGNFFYAWASWMRFAGVAGNVPILLSGAVEHSVGNFNSWIVDGMQGLLLGKRGKEYQVTNAIRQASVSDAAKQALAAAQILYHAGGMEAIEFFTSEDRHLDLDSVKTFVTEISQDPESAARRSGKKLAKVNEWIRRFTDAAIPFDFMFRKADSKRFFEKIMLNQAIEARAGRPALTSEQVEEALSFGADPASFVKDVLSTQAGRDAFVGTKNFTLDRINPLTAGINRLMRKSGVTNWAITTALDTYVSYGANLVQLLTPFSNTMSYLAVRGGARLNNTIRGEERENPALDYQLGGRDEFTMGLRKNFIYDAMKLGNVGLIAILGYFLIQALGLDDPDDDRAKLCWDEYKIGGETIRIAWWMNDLVGFGWPASVAMSVLTKHPDEPELAANVFMDGCYDMLAGSSLLDMINLITGVNENLASIDETLQNPDMSMPQNWQSEATKMFTYLLANSVGKSTPSIFKQYRDTMLPWVGQDARDRDAYKLYNPDNPDKTIRNEDELDIYNRSLAKGNPVWGFLMNLSHFGSLWANKDEGQTGYTFWEMPVATMKDQRRLQWMNDLDLQPTAELLSSSKEEIEQWYDDQAARLINYLENELPYASVEEALADGFIIPYSARTNAIDYCYKQILLNKLDFVQRSEAGEYPDFVSSYAASTRMNEKNSFYYDMIDKWFKNDDIPWSDAGYEKLLSDYQIYYRWKDSGEPATAWDAIAPWSNANVEKVYEPYGNHPTSFLPFTSVDRTGRGFNAETIPNWYREGLTNTQNVFDTSVGSPVKMGRDTGQDLGDVLFGGQESGGYAIDSATGVPTINHRAYVAADGALPDDIANRSLDDVAKEIGIDTEDLDGRYDDIISGKRSGGSKSSGGSGWRSYYPYGSSKKNYSTWKRYGGGGGGGSSYNPKIYSNPRSISADRAASMYTKQPYGATTTYLRPGFYTKGSREAYKRSDM